MALGRQKGNGDSKTHWVEIWRMPFCLTASRLMTIRGIKGQKTLGAVHTCAHWSECLCCRQNIKDGNMAERADVGG